MEKADSGNVTILNQKMPNINALKGVMYKGYVLGDIATHLGILLVFIIGFLTLNMMALTKYRKH